MPDFRMHRAGIDRALWNRLGFALAEIFLRIVHEFGAATRRTKIISVATMVGAVFGGMRVDRHAADRVNRTASGRVVMMAMFGHAHTLHLIPPGGI